MSNNTRTIYNEENRQFSDNMVESNSVQDNNTVIINKLLELPESMSKRQLKRVKKREKWLERKGEKRLGIHDIQSQHTKFYKLFL